MALDRTHRCPTVAFPLIGHHDAQEFDAAMLALQARQNDKAQGLALWVGCNDQVCHIRIVQRCAVLFFRPSGDERTTLSITLG
jgi:hypothetical protein